MPEVDGESPTLSQVIKQALEARICELHVSLPAKIVSYDGVKATVQPLIKRRFKNKTVKDLPQITNVPVLWPGDDDSIIIFPIKAGSVGTLLFSERSLDAWLVQGGSLDPRDVRKHHLSDAQFIPGLRSFNVASDYDPEKIVIKNKDGKITISPTGKFTFSNGVEELVDLIVQLGEKLEETQRQLGEFDTTNTIFGAQKPNNFATYSTLKADTAAILADLAKLKE